MFVIVDLVMGDTRKFFHDSNCTFTVPVPYVYIIFR